jgi:ParB-like chromosome segregation protein Spo0J
MILQDHPIAAIFPLLPEVELKALAEDIEENGLRMPILLLDGKILDGRNRYRACQISGVPIRTETFTGTEPVKHTLSLNLHRRHLTESQRAMVAAKLASLSKGANQHVSIDTPSRSDAANLLNVGEASVGRAKQVLKKSPELAEQVAAGTITVHAAQKAIAEAANPTSATESKIEINAAERIWATAKSQLDKITPKDVSREQVLKQVIAYCESRLSSRQ